MINFIIAKSINIFHGICCCISINIPCIPYLHSLFFENEDKDKINYKLYFGLISTNIITLISYQFTNNLCLISKYEVLFNPNKYKLIYVKNNFKNIIFLSVLFTSSQCFFKNFENRTLIGLSYYPIIFYLAEY